MMRQNRSRPSPQSMKTRFIAPLFLSMLPVVACTRNLSSSTVLKAQAPESDLEVEIVTGIPSSSFGPHPVRVYLNQGGKRDLLIRTPVFNDGKPLSKNNAKVTFEGDVISVCLLGTSPRGKLVIFNTVTSDYQVQEGSCEV